MVSSFTGAQSHCAEQEVGRKEDNPGRFMSSSLNLENGRYVITVDQVTLAGTHSLRSGSTEEPASGSIPITRLADLCLFASGSFTIR